MIIIRQCLILLGMVLMVSVHMKRSPKNWSKFLVTIRF